MRSFSGSNIGVIVVQLLKSARMNTESVAELKMPEFTYTVKSTLKVTCVARIACCDIMKRKNSVINKHIMRIEKKEKGV